MEDCQPKNGWPASVVEDWSVDLPAQTARFIPYETFIY
jgi:hypothetical protein